MRLLNIKNGFLETKYIEDVKYDYVAISHRWLNNEIKLLNLGLVAIGDSVNIGEKLIYNFNKNLNLNYKKIQNWEDYLNLDKNEILNIIEIILTFGLILCA